jgi:phenylpropionate dioxygenase-like ring-hydroxylating dioxygenase large terminal subunit
MEKMIEEPVPEVGVYGYEVRKARLGADSSGKMTYGSIIAGDETLDHPILRTDALPQNKSARIDFERYFKPEFVQLEVDHIWNRRWQVACREEDIPKVGDRINYEIVNASFVIVRSAPGEIKAFYNTCRHRGRTLCSKKENAANLRCPFHAWTWNLDGSLEWVPSHQDFPHVAKADYALPEVKVACWGGNVFINPDPDAGSLADELGILPELFAEYDTSRRHTVLHFRKKIRCNWKIAQEAFMESYHVLETHWDGMPFFGAAHCMYNERDEGEARINWLASPSLVPDFWQEGAVTPAEGLRQYCSAFGVPQPECAIATIADARAYLANFRAGALREAYGVDFSALGTPYLIDMVKAFMFPNFHPWWGEGLPWWYRFLPYGSDPDCCVMEVRVTQPNPVGRPAPPSPEPIDIDFDEHCGDFEALRPAGLIIDQDVANLVEIQKGLKAAKPGTDFMTLARYEESNIQHFHRAYNQLLGLN